MDCMETHGRNAMARGLDNRPPTFISGSAQPGILSAFRNKKRSATGKSLFFRKVRDEPKIAPSQTRNFRLKSHLNGPSFPVN